MVWPPPTIPATPVGEVPGAPPAGAREAAAPDSVSGAVPVYGRVARTSSVPSDWRDRPEGLVGCILGDRYRITAVIGRGPTGVACEGESPRGRQVTLKLLPRPQGLPQERFAWQLRQALALAHFDHPNVLPLTDFGVIDESLAFVSRARVAGVTLRKLLAQGSLPSRRALEIARQVAQALAAAHAQDIVHGRLKPENVIVQGGAAPGDVIRVVDFGMSALPSDARAAASNEGEARALAAMTRLYLPHAETPHAGPSTDVHALGVMLFEMLSGQTPFTSEMLGPAGPLAPPRTLADCDPLLQVPPAVADLIESLIDPRRAQARPSSGQVVEVLEGLMGQRSAPVPAAVPAPPSAPPNNSLNVVAPGASPNVSPGASANVSPGPSPNASQVPPAPRGSEASIPPSSGAVSWPPLPPGLSVSTFPPAPVMVAPSEPAQPPARLSSPSLPPQPSEPDLDDDTEFRPSLFARLRRLFSRSKA